MDPDSVAFLREWLAPPKPGPARGHRVNGLSASQSAAVPQRRVRPWPVRGVFGAQDWIPCPAPPVGPRDASIVVIGHGTPGSIAAAHRTEPWLAGMLLRPMLADLLESGTWWEHGTHRGMYRLCDAPVGTGACHALLIRNRAVYAYRARHAEADCPAPAPGAPRGRTWFTDPGHGWNPPWGTDRTAWRWLLHTSSAAPVLLARRVVDTHARRDEYDLDPGAEGIAAAYAAAAEAAAHAVRVLPPHAAPDVWEVHHGPWLWQIDTTTQRRKPAAVGLRAEVTARRNQARRLTPPL